MPHHNTPHPYQSQWNPDMKKNLLAIIVVILVAYQYLNEQGIAIPGIGLNTESTAQSSALQRAIDQQLSDIQVQGEGTVSRLLRDDLEGSRHQRFIVKLAGNQSILIAHNIDLAPKIDTLKKGDPVKFYGEYEWNNKGGVVHWTHRDPGGRHVDGWLEHQGRRYQ